MSKKAVSIACLLIVCCCLMAGCAQIESSDQSSASHEAKAAAGNNLKQIAYNDALVGKWQLIASASAGQDDMHGDTNGYLRIDSNGTCTMVIDSFTDGPFVGKSSRAENGYYILVCHGTTWVGLTTTLKGIPVAVFVDSANTDRIATFNTSYNLLDSSEKAEIEAQEKEDQFEDLLEEQPKEIVQTRTCLKCGAKGYRYSNPSGVGGNSTAGTGAYVKDDANFASIFSHGYCVSCWNEIQKSRAE